MGGVAPVAHIVRLAHQYDGYAYIDDAHGTSIYGDYGSGYVMACLGHRLDERIIIAGSLSKAFGSHGGFIACRDAETINFIKTYGTTYAFWAAVITRHCRLRSRRRPPPGRHRRCPPGEATERHSLF
jgi:7-keto-8-aminopelargonate synthetase-like enzyme